MVILLDVFRILLTLSGFYPPSLIRGVWLRRTGVVASFFLTAFTLFLVVQDVINFRRITSSSAPQEGGGGPVVPFSLQLYPTIIHLAILFLRLHMPRDLSPLLQHVSHFLGKTGIKLSFRLCIYLGACALQLCNTVYAAIRFPTADDLQNETFYRLENWANVLCKVFGVIWADIPTMDILAMGAVIYLTWVRDVLGGICQRVTSHNKGLDTRTIFIQEIWRGGGKLGRELEHCRELWNLWDASSNLLGLILLHCLWAWGSLFCIVTFNVTSITVDIGILDPMSFNFLFLFVCLAIKLIVITDAGHLINFQVTTLEHALVRLEWEQIQRGEESEDAATQLHALVAYRPISVNARAYFKVGRQTLAGIWGVVSTYVVVLLQFWASTRRPNLLPNATTNKLTPGT